MYREGDVESVLLRLGIETDQRNDELLGLCPMHLERTGRADSRPSWSMNVETGVHHCFSCGYRGTLLTLVAEINEFETQWGRLDFEAAKDWLRQNIEVNFELIAKQLEEAKNSYIPVQPLVEMSEARLSIFDSLPPDWALSARDLTAEACIKHSVKWDAKQQGWITPIRQPDTNKLMGWQEKGQVNRYFRNRPTGVQKSKTLFGLDVWSSGTMIIVESPLDVVKLSSLGIEGGVSTFGASISQDQVDLMRRADKLIIAFDNPRVDPAGEKASREMLARTKKEGLECFFFKYEGEYKDIGDMPEEQVILGIEGAKHSVFGERAYI
jgi:5S rRNA maturation endonuclease (ribonuclease M5)